MTTKPTIRRVVAGVTLVGALTLPLGGVAAATSGGAGDRAPKTTEAGPRPTVSEKTKPSISGEKSQATTVEGLKASCAKQITRRVADLDRLAARVAERAGTLTPAHVASIGVIITEAKAGLAKLQTDIDAATTVEALKPLCRRIVTDFRIYALRIPQVNLVLAADAIDAKKTKFDALGEKLAKAIADGKAQDNAAELDALLVEFNAHVSAMVAAANGVADKVLVLTPDDYNKDPKVLKPFVASMRESRNEGKRASKTARAILELLEGDDEHKDHAEHDSGDDTTPLTPQT